MDSQTKSETETTVKSLRFRAHKPGVSAMRKAALEAEADALEKSLAAASENKPSAP